MNEQIVCRHSTPNCPEECNYCKIDRLTKENEALKAEVTHQKERKSSIGNEVDKWRNRAVASLSRAEKAEAERDELKDARDAAIIVVECVEAERDSLLTVASIAQRLSGIAVVGHLTRCTCSKCQDFLAVESVVDKTLNHKEG